MRLKLLLLLSATALLASCGGQESMSTSTKESSEESSLASSEQSSSSEESVSSEESSEKISSEDISSEEESSEDISSEEETLSDESSIDSEEVDSSSGESSEDISSEEESSEEVSSEESSEDTLEEKTFKVQFKLFNGGKPTGDTKSHFLDVLQPYFLDNETQLLNSVSSEEDYFSQINTFYTKGEEDEVVPFTTLSLGSSSKYGKITLGFDYQITKVVIEAQAYHKFYSYTGYSGWSIDTDCVLGINEETLELPSSQDEEPETVREEYNYESGIDELTLSTEGSGRIFVNSLEITYLA